MAGLVFLLVFWVRAGACQRHGVGGFSLCNSSSSSSWSDRALRRDSGSGVLHRGLSPTGPVSPWVSRRAATPPSHRTDEPPSARAPGKRAYLSRNGPNGHSRRTARMRCPDAAVFRLSPPLVACPLTTLCHSQWPEPPRFADPTAPSPAAVEELTPPRDPTTRLLRASPRRP